MGFLPSRQHGGKQRDGRVIDPGRCFIPTGEEGTPVGLHRGNGLCKDGCTWPAPLRIHVSNANSPALHTGWSHAKHVLRVLDDHAGNKSSCRLCEKTIARETELSTKTVGRAIKHLVDQDLLVVFPKNHERRCNEYLLRRAEMCDRSGLSFAPTEPGDESRLSGTGCPQHGGRQSPTWGQVVSS